jgi:signal transduction histidine kinase
LSHEINKLIATLEIDETEINIVDYSELNEHEFNTVSEISFFLQIYDSDGNILIASNNITEFGSIPLELDVKGIEPVFSDMNVKEDRLRMGFVPLRNKNGEQIAILQLATFENELWFIRNRMIIFNLILLPGIIFIVIVASIFLAKKTFKPVNSIIETAERISARSLSSRIEYKTKPGDELGRLKDTLNKLFERIQLHVEQLSQFTDHASHQLMNPLTAIKAELEYILKRKRSDTEYEETLNKLRNQTDHMIKIVKTLLIISKQEKGDSNNQQIFNLSNLIRDNVQPEILSTSIKYNIDEGIYTKGDSEKFSIAFMNVIDNALKYSDNSVVNVEISKHKDSVVARISDLGIGISAEDKKKVFDRFYRTEESERLGIRGYGLGLSLSKSIIEEARGMITISDNDPKGTVVIIELPLVTLS